jgi:hypothetical protein
MNLEVISVILRNMYYIEYVFGNTHTNTRARVPKFILEKGRIPQFCPLVLALPPLSRTVTLPPLAVSAPVLHTVV